MSVKKAPQGKTLVNKAGISKAVVERGVATGLISTDVCEQVINGNFIDVFSLFGMHDYDAVHKKVTTFLPGALKVTVISYLKGVVLAELSCLHEAGLFCGLVKQKKTVPYKLRVHYPLSVEDIVDPYSVPALLDDEDLWLFSQGTQEQAYRFLGANHTTWESTPGVLFSVWAPNARQVALVSDKNHWDGRVHIMRKHPAAGIWEIFIPGMPAGSAYKFRIIGESGELLPFKADPYAKQMQLRPETASLVPDQSRFTWTDQAWLQKRRESAAHCLPISIYEVHLGSWRRNEEDGKRFLNYRELVKTLLPYVQKLGFTHIQLMPISEYPFDGSWGYQPIGLFAPTSRFGTPDDFKYFINAAHQAGIGILLDWVPGHFPTDEHGLAQFDGTHLYEHADPRQGFHPDWNTCIFNYSRSEVVSYLLSNALYWLAEFHIDGLRFDAVASMLYLDYSRKEGEWLANHHGGRENLEAIELLRSVNSRAYFNYPGVMMIAEESTAWPGVTDFIENGGLGFGFKWNLGWMNDTLSYMSRDPVHRKYHHNEMTFGLLYAFSENFILPLSHDEVVHGKHSILERIPGDDWQKFAGLRAYYAFMWTHPGRKLLFMGNEIAQRDEWNHDQSLDWHLLAHDTHKGVQSLVVDLNRVYVENPALYELDSSGEGFAWVEADNYANSVFIFLRKGKTNEDHILVAMNMTPTVRHDYRIGVAQPGYYREKINTDSKNYGGTGLGNLGGVEAEPVPSHGYEWSIKVILPPMATLVFKYSINLNQSLQ